MVTLNQSLSCLTANHRDRLQAIALEYLRHGALVAINHLGTEPETALVEALHRDADKIIAEAAEGEKKQPAAEGERERQTRRLITVPGDISQPETGTAFVARTVEAFGRLDVFVSNAGVCEFREFLEYVSLSLFLFDLQSTRL